MEKEENVFDLDKRIERYNLESAELLYDFASDLLNEVSDDDILKLYEDNNSIFSKLSNLSKIEILQEFDLLNDAVSVLIEHLGEIEDKKAEELEKEEKDLKALKEIIDMLLESIKEEYPEYIYKSICKFIKNDVD